MSTPPIPGVPGLGTVLSILWAKDGCVRSQVESTDRTIRVFAALACLSAAWTMPADGQVPAAVLGRIFDAESGSALADVAVVVEGTGFGTVTNDVGLFVLERIPPGTHALRIQHLAYGEVRDSIRLSPGEDLTLRINLSTRAIGVEGVIVESASTRQREARARGSSSNVVTRDEIEPMIGTGQRLDQVLARHISGINVRNPQTRAGTAVCVEFRAPRSLQGTEGCRHPTVFLDGVRVSNPTPLWTTFPIEQIERMEVVSSAEAGARYGTDSSYGVLLIETRTGRSEMGVENVTSRGRRTYDWALETEPYPWAKVFASSFVGNAAGLAAGALIGRSCIEFEEGLANSHFFLETSCDRLATAAVTTAMFGLPITGATFGANRAGRTDLSRGKWLPTAVAAALALVPGYILVVAKDDESFTGGRVIGWGALTIGVPAFTTIADRLFREFRSDPRGALTAEELPESSTGPGR